MERMSVMLDPGGGSRGAGRSAGTALATSAGRERDPGQAWLRPGSVVGPLRIGHEIRHGAFGTVYAAWDTVIGRAVAAKLVQPPPGGQLVPGSRLLGEARILGNLKSPHVATLYHVHEIGLMTWLFEMEYVGGGSLADLLGDDVQLPVAAAVRVGLGIARGLAAAHEAGIVHGDVKPENVLLDRDGTVKLVDFGLARTLCGRGPCPCGLPCLAGTPHYMAPEGIRGGGCGFASDVWSLGVLLHRMLRGSLPFPAPDVGRLYLEVVRESPPPLPIATPAPLAKFVGRCLAKESEGRPTDAAGDLEAIGETLRSEPLPLTVPYCPVGWEGDWGAAPLP